MAVLLVTSSPDTLTFCAGGNAYIASYFAGTNILLVHDYKDDQLQHFLHRLAPPGGAVEVVESWDKLLQRTQQLYL